MWVLNFTLNTVELFSSNEKLNLSWFLSFTPDGCRTSSYCTLYLELSVTAMVFFCFFVMKVHKLWYSDTDFTHLIHDPLHLMSGQLNVQWKWSILTLLKTVTVCSSLLLHRDWCGDHQSHRMYKNCSYNAKPLSHIHWYELVYLKEVYEDNQISPCKFPLSRCWIWAQRGRRRFSTGRRCLSPPMG